jgi:hypothetical protein
LCSSNGGDLGDLRRSLLRSQVLAGLGHLRGLLRSDHPGLGAMTAPCMVCGAQMKARRSTRRFCSTRCRMENYRNPGLSVTEASVAPPIPVSTATPSVPRAATSPGGGLAAIAVGISTPADTFGLARAYCEVRGGGFGVVFGLDGGRKNEPAGPVFPKPKTAVDLAALFNGRLSV